MIPMRLTLFRNLVQYSKNILLNPTFSRCFHISTQRFLKQIEENKADKTLIIEANIIPDPNDARLLKSSLNTECCSVCSLNLEIKHTDVLILSQFVRSDGCMLPRRVTGLCRLQQRRISKMVAMAQKAGLMAILAPERSKKNPQTRKDWKKFNTYFDESTIKPPRDYKSHSYQL